MDKNNTKAMGILLVIGFPLILAFWTHIRGSYEEVYMFFNSGDVTIDALKKVFTALLGLIISIITLFTPTKALKSPLSYLSVDIAAKWESLKAVKDDPEKKRTVFIEMGVTLIYLVVLVASYFYILKSIVKYDADYHMTDDAGIIRVLFFLIVISVFLAFTSFVVGKLQDIDKENSDESARQQQKTYWSIGLIVGVIVSIALGNAVQTYVSDYISSGDSEIGKEIYRNLGGEKENLGDVSIDGVFDK